jgi:hypothetical protein
VGTKADNEYLFTAPAIDGEVSYRKNVTEVASGFSALPPGRYVLSLFGTIDAFCRVGAVAALPADDGSAEGFALHAGSQEGLDLSEKTASSTLSIILVSAGTGIVLARRIA